MFGQLKLSPSQMIWQLLLIAISSFIAIETSLSIAFKFPIMKWHIISDIIICIVFLIDFIYKFRYKILRKKTSDFYKLNYVTATIDLLAIIPIDVILSVFFPGNFLVIRIFRFLKFFKLAKIYNIIIHLTIVPKYLKIAFITVCATIAIHWIACGWNLINSPMGIDIYTSYNKSLYWAVTTLTTIGYGDITPVTNIGRLYTMMIMILGIGVYGIVIGNVTRVFSQADRYKEQTRTKMNDLALYMKHYNVPIKLQNSVFGYYNHLFTKRLSENDIKIIAELPHPLQKELQCYMNMKLITNIPAFKYCSHNCLKEIAQSLEQMYFSPGQRIIKIGEVGSEMYIIGHGQVEMYNDKKESIVALKEGQFFGEVSLLEEREIRTEIKAISYCDLYKLKKDDFIRIIKKYPELLTSLQKSMSKRSNDQRQET